MKGAGNVRDILKIGKLGWWEWFSSKGSLFCHSGSDFACCLSNQGPCFSYDSYDAVFIPLGALENKKQSSSSMHFGLDNLLWVPSNLKNSMILWIDEGILDVFCAVCICSPSHAIKTIWNTRDKSFCPHIWGLKYMDRPCTVFTKSCSFLGTAGSHQGSNPLCGRITLPAKYVTWFSFKHIQNKSLTRQTFNSGLVSKTVMEDSSQHQI